MDEQRSTNGPSADPSPQGRRILIAVMGGDAGREVERWRAEHDPIQARRLPPHTTLCYWPPIVETDRIERQLRHALPGPLTVRLGRVHEFQGEEHGFYLPIVQAAALDAARTRLYDGMHLDMGAPGTWPWHITCVRNAHGRDLHVLRLAASALKPPRTWVVNEVSYQELQGDRYVSLATWKLEG